MLNPKKRKKILTRLITPRCIGKFITGPPDRPRGGDKLQSGWKMAIEPWRRSENASTILGISIHQERARMLELNKKMFTSLSSVKWNIVDQPLHYQLFLSCPGEGHRLKIYERLHCKWAQRTRKDREIKSVKKSRAAGWRGTTRSQKCQQHYIQRTSPDQSPVRARRCAKIEMRFWPGSNSIYSAAYLN